MPSSATFHDIAVDNALSPEDIELPRLIRIIDELAQRLPVTK